MTAKNNFLRTDRTITSCIPGGSLARELRRRRKFTYMRKVILVKGVDHGR